MTPRVAWAPIIARAAELMDASTYALTLRGLHYRLVSDAKAVGLGYRNVLSHYKRLSALTAATRRAGSFPALDDLTRAIDAQLAQDGPADALRTAAAIYRRDRTEGQDWAVVVGVEKRTLGPLLADALGDELGVPVVALAGYASQTLADDVAGHVAADGRPAVLLYAGDFDPSGEDIERDWRERTGCWAEVERVALTAEVVADYRLPESIGKDTDSRAARFAARHGGLVQVELEALDPGDLIDLYRAALAPYWDTSTLADVLAREAEERAALQRLADAA